MIIRFLFVFIYLKIFRKIYFYKFKDLNFNRIDFTNYKLIKSFIFKEKFYNIDLFYVHSFDFLNYSKKIGGDFGIEIGKKNLFAWYLKYRYKLRFPWNNDLTSRRLINLIYNYEFISSSLTKEEYALLSRIITEHVQRVIFEINRKKYNDITSYDLKAIILIRLGQNRVSNKFLFFINKVLLNQIDNLGVHKSYNLLEHAKFINNLHEIKNIFLYFKKEIPEEVNTTLMNMDSIMLQYFHLDGSIPLFNGSNNNYTKLIYSNINKGEFFRKREFLNTDNGIAFYSDDNKKIFFDIVQPNRDSVSKTLSAGTLSFEFSAFGEKLITNCGSLESAGKNPEYLRYSAAHSTIVLQNTNISEIKSNNPHIKFPQRVSFNSYNQDQQILFEGSHNGYANKFDKIIKRLICLNKNNSKIFGEDSIISTKNNNTKIIYHIRFHIMPDVSLNLTNNKRNIILRTKLNNIWMFKASSEASIEDSLYVDNNLTQQIKQIVIKGVTKKTKHIEKWSLEKI